MLRLLSGIIKARFVRNPFIGHFCTGQIRRTMANSDQARQWARSMYIYENRTQQEIAEAIGVSRQTVIRWAKADKWDEYKVSMTMTREEQIKNLQRQLSEINRCISERNEEAGPRYATAREADIICKLTDAINKLENDVGIHDVVSVANRFISWLRPVDLELTKTFAGAFDKFIKSLL